MQEKKYGLQIRAPKSQQKQQTRPALVAKPSAFNDNDDDDDVETEISRQAAKNKSLKDVEEQYKKAIEEDPTIFDYDGVYDDFKAKIQQPKAQDRQERQPRYIQALMEKAKKREREQEIVYERKLAKERSKDDHLFADKDKFLTSAYKRKLAEQEKWKEEERLRELREQRDDVTKKSDITDFYFNLSKNVAFGAREKSKKLEIERDSTGEELKEPEKLEKEPEKSEKEPDLKSRVRQHPSTSSTGVSPSILEERGKEAASLLPEINREAAATHALPPQTSGEKNTPPSDQPKQDHHKKSADALAAAKERFLARKKAKVQ